MKTYKRIAYFRKMEPLLNCGDEHFEIMKLARLSNMKYIYINMLGDYWGINPHQREIVQMVIERIKERMRTKVKILADMVA